ncbi:MAG: GTPase HflX [Acidimicrobiia bacterium]
MIPPDDARTTAKTEPDDQGDVQERTGRRRRRLTATITDLEVGRQRAFLVGVALPGTGPEGAQRSLDELGLLSETAGSDPVDTELVKRSQVDPATFIGKGKAEELAALVKSLEIDVVVFDNDLTPAQQRNLQRIFECDVVDREALILDIFAQHASSREGSIQVELALLRYHLPRLRGKGTELSRLGGGIGTRGPGETKLETDRRRILTRISRLERELGQLAKTRQVQRKARRRSQLPQVSLVGYTNAGKSTLLNRLTEAGVLAEDQLFSTLDSTVRRCDLPDGSVALLSDTVGFVRRLPHQLVEAFRSTLEEVREADLLLHLVDASDPDPDGQVGAVREVLGEIGAQEVPELLVLNKADAAKAVALRRLAGLHPEAVIVSALTGGGADHLLQRVAEEVKASSVAVRLEIPYARGDVLAAAHRLAEVLAEKHEDHATVVEARIPRDRLPAFAEFLAG